MLHLQDFNSFLTQIFESNVGTWVQSLSEDPRWSTMQDMGFKEVNRSTRPGTRSDSFLVEAPDGKLFILTKAGYVRRPGTPKYGMGISNSVDAEDLPAMLIYLMERYKPYFKRKIGRSPSPEEIKILDQIENLKKAEEKKRGLGRSSSPSPAL